MYCKKCGTDMGNSTFCPHCGQPASVPEYDAEVVGGTKNASNNEQANGYSGIKCPHCGSNNCQPMTETKVSGGGYDPGSGCCGYILFGPLGLLCGACNSGTTSSNRTYWICRNCGRRFNG